MVNKKGIKKDNKLLRNTIMLYIMNITKLVLPLITLPYLTRVLSVDTYGVVTYVKSIMSYMQMIIDFGFILSATKDIVRVNGDRKKIGLITGNAIIGKVFLSLVSLIVLLVMIIFIPILRENVLFTLLSFVPVFLTTFLFDFLFRGLEKMEIITYRYLIMKGISTVLTFVFVRSNNDLLYIPLLDILGTIVAVIWVNSTLKKVGISITFGHISDILSSLKESFSYFLSNIATTAFGALNTVVIGIVLTKSDIAYWSLIMQLVNAVQALYSPILDGVYPEMVRNQKIKLIVKIIILFTPIILVGCGITYFGAGLVLRIVGGYKYIGQAYLLKLMIPVLFFSFYSMLFGWPVLGAIDKVRQTTITTILTSFVQIAGIILLILIGHFSLLFLTILRGFTEFTLLALRGMYFWKYRFEFSDYKRKTAH